MLYCQIFPLFHRQDISNAIPDLETDTTHR
jgi:hypothetical protein